MGVWMLPWIPDLSVVLTSQAENVDVTLGSTNSTSRPAEAEQPGNPGTSAASVSDVSLQQQKKRSDWQDGSGDSSEKDEVNSSLLTSAHRPGGEAIPSSDPHVPESQMIQVDGLAAETSSYHQDTAAAASLELGNSHSTTTKAAPRQQKDSQNQTTEAAPRQQNDYQSQTVGAGLLRQKEDHSQTSDPGPFQQEYHSQTSDPTSLQQEYRSQTSEPPPLQQQQYHSQTSDPTSLQQEYRSQTSEPLPLQQQQYHRPTSDPAPVWETEYHSQTSDTAPLQQNEFHSPTSEATPSLQDSDFQDQITLVDREGYAEAFVAERIGISGTKEEMDLSNTSERQESNPTPPDESTRDHTRTSSQYERSAMALARLQAAIRGLSEKREAVLGMRVKVQEARNAARQTRSTLTELNAEILQGVQRKAALGLSSHSMSSPEVWAKLQDCLEELQLKEAELSGKEDALNREEWELKEAELAVYQSLDFERANILGEQSSSLIDELTVDTASVSTFSVQPRRTPLEKQYLSRKGDADILNEEIDELRARRAYLVEEERARQPLGVSLDAESQSFLQTFDVRHNQLQQDLLYAEEDIFRLQTMLSNTHDDIFYSASHFDLTQVGSSLLSDDGDAPDPLLLNKEAPSPSFANLPLEADQSRLSTLDYINEWLLHRLRRSPLEVLLFKTELQGVHLDSKQLKDLVLRTWPSDAMSKAYLEARQRSRRSFSYNARSRRANLSIQAAQSDSDIYHVNLFGQDSKRGALTTSRHRSSVTLDLLNHQRLPRPSAASSV